MAERPLPPDVERAKDRLIAAGGEALRRDLVPPGQRPAILYHFTDVGGLMGIVGDKTLWASYAASLNDPSEMLHGIGVARAVLQEGVAGVLRAFCSDVLSCLDGKSVFDSPFSLEWRPYVVSLSEGHEHASHWLHYGRNGTGYAVEVLTDAVAVAPFDLIRVLYRDGEQRELVRHIVARMYESLVDVRVGLSDPEQEAIRKATIHMTATFLRGAAVRMKHPGFADEREWRLVTYDLVINGEVQRGGIDLPKKRRVVAGRIVPYMVFEPAGRFVAGIVRGWSAAMSPEDPALRMLLSEAGIADVEVKASTLPVRP